MIQDYVRYKEWLGADSAQDELQLLTAGVKDIMDEVYRAWHITEVTSQLYLGCLLWDTLPKPVFATYSLDYDGDTYTGLNDIEVFRYIFPKLLSVLGKTPHLLPDPFVFMNTICKGVVHCLYGFPPIRNQEVYLNAVKAYLCGLAGTPELYRPSYSKTIPMFEYGCVSDYLTSHRELAFQLVLCIKYYTSCVSIPERYSELTLEYHHLRHAYTFNWDGYQERAWVAFHVARVLSE